MCIFFQISNEKYKIEKNPSDVLNKLGSRGYRVVGFTITADEKLAWTLELKNFEIPWKCIRKQCWLSKKKY